MGRPVGVRIVGRDVSRCSRIPQLAALPGAVPSWEAFPEVSRILAERLLGLLVERMVASAGGRSGDERDERVG
jgi:hypothetical protein